MRCFLPLIMLLLAIPPARAEFRDLPPERIQALLGQEIEQMQKNLPMKVAANANLIELKYEKHALRFVFDVQTSDADSAVAAVKGMAKEIQARNCMQFLSFMESGVIERISNVYMRGPGKLGEITTDTATCKLTVHYKEDTK